MEVIFIAPKPWHAQTVARLERIALSSRPWSVPLCALHCVGNMAEEEEEGDQPDEMEEEMEEEEKGEEE